MHSLLFGVLLLLLSPFSLAEDKPLEKQSPAELRDAIAADPTNLGAYYHLARSYLGLRQAPLKSDSKSLDEDLQASSSFYEDALLRIEDGEDRAAIIQLMNAIKVNETNVAAYMLLAQTYEEMRVPRGAAFYLREALKHGADPYLVLVPLGQALLAREKYEEVLDELSLAGLPRGLKARVRVLHGKAYMGLQEFEKAERILKEALSGDDTVIGAQIELARLDLMRGASAAAQRRLDSIKSAGEFVPDYWLLRGELERIAGNFEDAIVLYQMAINIEDDHILSLHAAAALNLDIGNIPEARALISIIREFYPNDLRGIWLELMLVTRQRDMDARQRVIADADGVIKSVDFLRLQDDPYNLILIGSIHHLTGRMNLAAPLLHRYLEFSPSDLGALRLLVTAQLRLRNPDAAIAALEKTRKYHGDEAVWLKLFSEVRIQQKRYAQALSYFDRVIQINPQDGQSRLRRATLNATMGNHEAALKELELLRGESSDPSIGVTQANILVTMGRFDDALDLVAELETSGGKNSTLLNIKGNAYLGRNELNKARNSFNYALIEDPDAVSATFNIATLDLKEGDVAAAKKRFLEILAKNDTHFLSMIQLSNIEQRKGDRREAIRYLQSAMQVRLEIKNGLRLVNLLIADEQLQEAREMLTNLRVAHPDDIGVIVAEANWSIRSDNPDRAKQLYLTMRNQAVRNDSVAEMVMVARYQQAVGDLFNAALTLDAAQKMDENNLVVLVARAELMLTEDRYEDALFLSNKVISLVPEQAVGYRLKGDSHSLLNEQAKALEAYRAGVDKTTGSVTLVLRYYGSLRDHEGAIKAVEFLEDWVVDNKIGNFTILRALAAGHADIGNTTKAIKLNEALIASNQDDVTLLNNLALLYLETGDDRAQSFAEKAYNLAPRNYAIMDTLGWVLTIEGDAALGIAMLRNAMTLSANVMEIRYHYAVALHKTGQSKNALKELRTLLSDGKPFSGMEDARLLYKQLSDDV